MFAAAAARAAARPRARQEARLPRPRRDRRPGRPRRRVRARVDPGGRDRRLRRASASASAASTPSHVRAAGRHRRVRRVEDRLRTEGATYSIFSFTRKVGQAVGAAAASYTIGLGGYVSGAASQPDGASTRSRSPPASCPPSSSSRRRVMIPYPLTEERFREIVREVAERRAAPDQEA